MTHQAVEPTTAGPSPHPFTGRERELGALCDDIVSVGLHTLAGQPLPHCRVLLIAGAPGSGRTALAEEFVRRIADRYPGGVLRARLTESGGTPVPGERAARDLLAALARLGTAVSVPPPGADDDTVTAALRDALARRGRLVLLLDDVAHADQVLDLAPESRDCLVVAVSAGPLTGVPDVRPCTLGGLDRASAVAMLTRYAGSAPRITVDPRGAEALAERCGDLPAALTLMGGWFGAHPKLSVLDATRALDAVAEAAGSGEQEPPAEAEGEDPAEDEGPSGRPRPGAGHGPSGAYRTSGAAGGHAGVPEDPDEDEDDGLEDPDDGDSTDRVGGRTARGDRVDRAAHGDHRDFERRTGHTGHAGHTGHTSRADHGSLAGHSSPWVDRDGEDGPAAPPRARTRPPAPLVHTFRLVHDSLATAPARLLRLLALAPAGFVDPQIASALGGCSVSTAHAALDRFVRLGLLRALGGDRYQVPGCLDPLLRAELAARERPADTLLARARMLERLVRQLQACRAVCEPAGSPARDRMAELPHGLRFTHPAGARAWLETRRPALLAATRTAVTESQGALDTLARRLVSALARAFDAHREPEEAAPELYRLHELVLRVAERGRMPRERAAALLNLGDLDARNDRFEQALVRYRTALDAAREGGDEQAAGRAMESLGACYAELEEWERAADWYGRALEARLAQDRRADQEAAARLHGRIGTVHACAGSWEEALRAWRAAAAAFRRLHDPADHARALAEVARVQQHAERPQEALRTFKQALAVAYRAGEEGLAAALELRTAEAAERVGELRAARRHRAAARRLLGGREPDTGPGLPLPRGAGRKGDGDPRGPRGHSAEPGGAGRGRVSRGYAAERERDR